MELAGIEIDSQTSPEIFKTADQAKLASDWEKFLDKHNAGTNKGN